MNVDLQAAKIYGEAFFESAKAADAVAQVWEEGRALLSAAGQVPGFIALMEAPHVPSEDKMAIGERVLGDRFHRLLKNFVMLLLKRNRIEILRASLEHFHYLAEKDQGISSGTVTTAKSLDDSEKQRLLAALERQTRLRLNIDYKVDPAVLGGVRFKSGDLLIDNSLQTQMAHLKEKLMLVKVH